jgi:hypothetical protein
MAYDADRWRRRYNRGNRAQRGQVAPRQQRPTGPILPDPPKRDRPRQRYQRPRQQPRRQPYDPLQPLQGPSFREELDRMVGSQYGPLERELGAQRGAQERISTQHQANLGSWYDNYLNERRAAEQRTQAAYGQAQQGVVNQANLALGQDQQAAAGQQQQAQQSAAMRGATADPQMNEQAQNAAAARQALALLSAGTLGTLGANQASFMASQTGTAAGQAAQSQADEQARYRGLMTELDRTGQSLAREKGDYRYKARGELTDRERTYALNREAFGLQVREQEEEERSNRAQEAQDRRELRRLIGQEKFDRLMARKQFRLDVKKFGVDRAYKRWQKQHGEAKEERMWAQGDEDDGGEPKYTQSQKNENQGLFRRAKSVNLSGIPRPDWIEYVSDTKDIDPLIVRAALLPGSLTERQRAELRRMGIKVGGRRPGGFEQRSPGRRGGGQFNPLS